MNARRRQTALALSFALLAGCGGKARTPPNTAGTPPVDGDPAGEVPAATPKLDGLARADFNRAAAELALPLFWTRDGDGNGALDPGELAVYWGLDPSATLGDYVDAGRFTPKMLEAYARIAARARAEESDPRKAAVRKELAQGRVTLVATDLSRSGDADKRFVASIFKIAALVERLYAKQQAVADLAAKIPADDPASKTLFFRTQGPKCEAPLTENDPNCGALLPADMPKTKLSGMYPAARLAQNPKFCDELQKSSDKALLDPFTVVVETDKGLVAKPFHEAWPEETGAIAEELDAAAAALGAEEPALREYLVAAAKAFRTDEWWPADEAWAKMDAKNSKYFLRVGPDEVYDEPCSVKALYHVSFALINQGSVAWQEKLDPLKGEMEKALAALAGPPYKAREVSFKLPDFIDVALNAGDSRKPFGATIGQSLPNFGPVANGGRGRTVAMTNFYTDPDSIAASHAQAESLFCKDTMEKWTDAKEPQLMSTVLHEAAHNLGPAHQYKVGAKIDRQLFGGPLASTLEELKAQTSALYFTDWLVDKKQITREEADRAHVRDVFWAFGHISRGMYGENHHPKNYSQLAAIQIGTFMKAGAVAWKADARAANGQDEGCFTVDLGKMTPAIAALMTDVARIKGRGDKARADALIKSYVDVTGDKKKVHEVITERMNRAPKASFVYAVTY